MLSAELSSSVEMYQIIQLQVAGFVCLNNEAIDNKELLSYPIFEIFKSLLHTLLCIMEGRRDNENKNVQFRVLTSFIKHFMN